MRKRIARSSHGQSFLTAALAAALLLTACVAPALAQRRCADRAEVLNYLARKYREVPVSIGVTSNGGMVEVLTAGDGGTWTIIVTSHHGESCMVLAGDGWRDRETAEPNGDPL